MMKPGLFGKLLKKRRLEIGLTMEQMARKIRTTKGYISGIENGHIPPFGPKKIPRAALVLGVDVEIAQILAWADKAPKLVRPVVQQLILAWLQRLNRPGDRKVVQSVIGWESQSGAAN